MNEQNVVYTYNEILFNIKKEILTYTTTWVKFEDIMLNERSYIQKQILYDSTYVRYPK